MICSSCNKRFQPMVGMSACTCPDCLETSYKRIEALKRKLGFPEYSWTLKHEKGGDNMPYEYQVFYREFEEDPLAPKGDLKIEYDTLLDWLNELGAQDWRLVKLLPEWCGHVSGIFERKIEVNPKLRDIQLGIEPETEKENEPDDGKQSTGKN